MTLDEDLRAYKEGRLSETELRERIRAGRDFTGRMPMSEGQRGLWMEHVRTPDGSGYNVPLGLEVHGPLRVEYLRDALAHALAEHEVLRGVVQDVDGAPYLRIDAAPPAPLFQEDWTGRGTDAARARLAECARLPFDLAHGPLLRLHVLTCAPHEHLALIVVHHVVFDGASWPLLLGSLLDAYDALASGCTLSAPTPQCSYRDFVQWEQQLLSGGEALAHRAYWQRQLAGPLPVIELPADRARLPLRAVESRTHAHVLDIAASQRLRDAGRALGTSAATYLLAVFQLLLERYTLSDDIVVGMPTLGRPQARFEGTIGYFVNMVAIRSRLRREQTFAEFVRELRATVADALDHGVYPFPTLVRDLSVSRDHAPVFQVAYSYQSTSLFGRRGVLDRPASGLRLEPLESITRESPFGEYEFALEVRESAAGCELAFKYDDAVFERSRVARTLQHYLALLEGVMRDPTRPLRAYSLLDAAEREQILVQWNDTNTDGPRDATVQVAFERQARATPEAIAVLHEGQRLDYGDLNRRANRVARHLRQHGVGPDVLVATCLSRSVEMVVALLGILKAGGAYLPLDPDYPRERLDYMLRDATPRVVLTQAGLQPSVPATTATVVALDTQWREIARHADDDLDPLDVGVRPEHLAYVIYTSGSTGRPKGVGLPHRALVNLLDWQRLQPYGARPQRTLQFAALGFDVAFQEIFGTLGVGGSLVLAQDAVRRDAHALVALLRGKAVQRLFLPFSALQALAESLRAARLDLPDLEDVVTAGEQLRVSPAITELFERLRTCRLHNHYGPTESHVVTAFTLPPSPAEWPALPPIGRPIANTRVHLLDSDGEPVPVGVPGEIHLAGVALARGYLHRPDLTAGRFVCDPFAEAGDGRLYRTGDMGRYREDGQLEFLGRNDDQVKVRGFRVELGEIEAHLSRHAHVKDAAVAARRDEAGEMRLVAYVTPAPETTPDAARLQAHLKASLPDYMVPAAFVVLPALPLTPNGKLDRRALPAPAAYVVQARYEAPVGVTEEALCGLWQRVLRVERVGRHDDFFDLGGHSLLAMHLIARLREDLGINVPPNAVFEHHTVATLAEYVDAAGKARQLAQAGTEPGAGPRQRGVV
jgi:amino acid adenylation domain-containing protein